MSQEESAKQHNLPIHLTPAEDDTHTDTMQVKLLKDVYHPDVLEEVKDQSPHVSNLRHIYQGVKEVDVRVVKKKDYRPDDYIAEEEAYKQSVADGTYGKDKGGASPAAPGGTGVAGAPSASTGPGNTGPGSTTLTGPSTGERGTESASGGDSEGPKPAGVSSGDTEDSPEEASLNGF